jgi:hypothetical protein
MNPRGMASNFIENWLAFVKTDKTGFVGSPIIGWFDLNFLK